MFISKEEYYKLKKDIDYWKDKYNEEKTKKFELEEKFWMTNRDELSKFDYDYIIAVKDYETIMIFDNKDISNKINLVKFNVSATKTPYLKIEKK